MYFNTWDQINIKIHYGTSYFACSYSVRSWPQEPVGIATVHPLFRERCTYIFKMNTSILLLHSYLHS